MPIETEETSIKVTLVKTVQANKLHIDSINIDASGEVKGTSVPKLSMQTRLYAEIDENGTRAYDDHTQQIAINDIYAACANVPQIAQAMQAIFVATAAIRAYRTARKADLATLQDKIKQKAEELASLKAADPVDEDAVTQTTADLAALNAKVMAASLAIEDPSNPKVEV